MIAKTIGDQNPEPIQQVDRIQKSKGIRRLEGRTHRKTDHRRIAQLYFQLPHNFYEVPPATVACYFANKETHRCEQSGSARRANQACSWNSVANYTKGNTT